MCHACRIPSRTMDTHVLRVRQEPVLQPMARCSVTTASEPSHTRTLTHAVRVSLAPYSLSQPSIHPSIYPPIHPPIYRAIIIVRSNPEVPLAPSNTVGAASSSSNACCSLALHHIHSHLLKPSNQRGYLLSPMSTQQPSRDTSSVATRGAGDDGLASVCAICQHQAREPLVTQCRHCFCGACIKALLDGASMRPIDCPVCRSSIFDSSELSPMAVVEASSSSAAASTPCTNRDHGCSWRGSSRSLDVHLSTTCMHHPCPNRTQGCSWTGTIGATLVHQATECDASSNHDSSDTTTASSSSSSSSSSSKPSRADKAVRALLSRRVFAIDVGDRTFRASEQTLRSESGSVLDRMFSGEYELPRGSYHLGFVDHNDDADDDNDDGDDCGQREDGGVQSDGRAHRKRGCCCCCSRSKRARPRERRVFIDCDARSFEHVLEWLQTYGALDRSLIS